MTLPRVLAPDAPVIDLVEHHVPAEDLQAAADVLRSGWLTMGPRTLELEAAVAAQLGVAHAVAASSDAATLHLALLAVGVGPGDEVIVPGVCGAPAARSARRCGASVVAAEVLGPADPTLDPDALAAAITPRTRAEVAVAVGGRGVIHPAVLDRVLRAGIALVEHVPGQAGGATVDRALGTHGTVGCLALLPGAGAGGAAAGILVTDDEALAAHARSRRSHAMTSGTWARHTGRTDTYDVEDLGFNYRIDEVRAVLAAGRLRRAPEQRDHRLALALRYTEALDHVHGVTTVPTGDGDADTMPIVLAHPEARDDLRARLAAVGISTLVPDVVPAELPPRAAAVTAGLVLLPLHAGMTDADVLAVARAVEEALDR